MGTFRTIHDYECWLGDLDEFLYSFNGRVISKFGLGLVIPFSACRSEQNMIEWAVKLARTLEDPPFPADSTYLPTEYLIKRFFRLAAKGNSITVDQDDLFAQVEKKLKPDLIIPLL